MHVDRSGLKRYGGCAIFIRFTLVDLDTSQFEGDFTRIPIGTRPDSAGYTSFHTSWFFLRELSRCDELP